jgi:multidrug efflux system membrane fusion protein
LWIVVGALVVAIGFYFGTGAFIAYTADAYVRSDLIAVAPEVSGVIKTVAVQDNQRVAAGDPIATIDPEPFQLDVELKQRQVDSFDATVAVKVQAQSADAANIDAAIAELRLAQEQFDRVKALAGDQVISQSEFDKVSEQLRAAQDRLTGTRNQAQVDEREIGEVKAQVMVARAALAVAQYQLSRTQLMAPAGGYINNLRLRPGDYARAGAAIVGIVDNSRWRVVANFKEEVAASIGSEKRVWVWLDSAPWHLLRGHVQGVGRGIAREQSPDQLLPYVAPTTDWIRLQRRLPVTILLDQPEAAEGLYMGADARVFFFR